MKLTIQRLDIRSTSQLDTLVKREMAALRNQRRIDQANVRLEYRNEMSPPFRVRVHLITPGPDFIAEAHDHTIQAAVTKVTQLLERRMTDRTLRRKQRLKTKLSTRRNGQTIAT